MRVALRNAGGWCGPRQAFWNIVFDGQGKELELYENDFEGFVTIRLTFKNCSLTSLPKNIFNVNSITSVNFENCSPFLRGRNILDELNDVYKISLSQLPQEVLPSLLTSIPKAFTTVSMYGNNLETISEEFFANSKEIRELNLVSNKFQKLPEKIFYPLSDTLQKLTLTDQTFLLDKNQFKGLENLKEIFLEASPESISGSIFHPLSSIEKIQLKNTKLTSISDELFSGLKSLRYVDISDNNISEIGSGVFNDNKALDTLIINYTLIKSLPVSSLSGVENLKCLSLNYWGYFYYDEQGVARQYPVLSEKNRKELIKRYPNLSIQMMGGSCKFKRTLAVQ